MSLTEETAICFLMEQLIKIWKDFGEKAGILYCCQRHWMSLHEAWKHCEVTNVKYLGICCSTNIKYLAEKWTISLLVNEEWRQIYIKLLSFIIYLLSDFNGEKYVWYYLTWIEIPVELYMISLFYVNLHKEIVKLVYCSLFRS